MTDSSCVMIDEHETSERCRERTEESVVGRESNDEDLYRRLFDLNPMPMWLYDSVTFRFLEVNGAAIRHYGYSREEFLGMTILDLLPHEPDATSALSAGGLEGPTTYSGEWKHRKKNGDIIIVSVWTERFDSDHPTRLAVIEDITIRKRAEHALKVSEERMRAILNTATDAIVTIDRNGTILRINPATERMFGYSKDELLGQNVSILMPEPYADEHNGYLERYLRTHEPRIIGIGREIMVRRKDGSTLPVDLAVSEVDHLEMFTGIMRDITERKQLQQHLVEMVSEEQQRIGQELHDGTGQELTGLALFARKLVNLLEELPVSTDGTERICDAGSYSRMLEITSRIAEGISESGRRVKALSHGIMPVQIDAGGLQLALEELAAFTSSLDHCECQFETTEKVRVRDNQMATQLYRIAQEAVNNAMKHSRAKQILISLLKSDSEITLEVRDDGIGIGSEEGFGHLASPSGGMGLRTMSYRAGLIGGHLKISNQETGGTVVRCTVPRVRGAGINDDSGTGLDPR